MPAARRSRAQGAEVTAADSSSSPWDMAAAAAAAAMRPWTGSADGVRGNLRRIGSSRLAPAPGIRRGVAGRRGGPGRGGGIRSGRRMDGVRRRRPGQRGRAAAHAEPARRVAPRAPGRARPRARRGRGAARAGDVRRGRLAPRRAPPVARARRRRRADPIPRGQCVARVELRCAAAAHAPRGGRFRRGGRGRPARLPDVRLRSRRADDVARRHGAAPGHGALAPGWTRAHLLGADRAGGGRGCAAGGARRPAPRAAGRRRARAASADRPRGRLPVRRRGQLARDGHRRAAVRRARAHLCAALRRIVSQRAAVVVHGGGALRHASSRAGVPRARHPAAPVGIAGRAGRSHRRPAHRRPTCSSAAPPHR